MLSIFERLKTWWTTAERNQRIATLGGIGALVLLLVGTVVFVSRPHYKPLLRDLADADQVKAVDALKAKGIPVQTGPGGSIEVPENAVDDANLELARTGTLPPGGHIPFDEAFKGSPVDPPEVTKARLKAFQEGEIARTLQGMEGVASAQVIIAQPENRLFSAEQQAPTASVTLVENGGGTLTKANGKMIANLVCASVPGMKPTGVVVVSNTLGELWSGKDDGGGGSKRELDNLVAQDWRKDIQLALEEAFGIGNTRVIVRANVDTDQRKVHQHEVTPAPKPSSIRTGKESMDRAKGLASGPAGTASNTERAPATPPTDGDGKGKYVNEQVAKDYPNNETETVTEVGVGALKGIAITVIVNSDTVPDASKVKEIVDGVLKDRVEQDANGNVLPNQRYATTVTSVKFNDTAAKAAKEAADHAASQQRIQQILSLLPIAVILVVALLVAKQVGKISKAILPTPEVADGALAEEPDALPEGEGPDALPAPEGVEEDIEESPMLLEQFKGPIDVPLESLKQMATERPEMVATLIKSMMLGERA